MGNVKVLAKKALFVVAVIVAVQTLAPMVPVVGDKLKKALNQGLLA